MILGDVEVGHGNGSTNDTTKLRKSLPFIEYLHGRTSEANNESHLVPESDQSNEVQTKQITKINTNLEIDENKAIIQENHHGDDNGDQQTKEIVLSQ